LTCTRDDYVAFANDLITGQGETIVRAWEALRGGNVAAIDAARTSLVALKQTTLVPGPLKGLLFGDPARFILDLELQLNMMGTLETLYQGAIAQPQDPAAIKAAFAAFIDAHVAWQQQHAYKNNWYDGKLWAAIGAIKAPASQETLKNNVFVGEGETMFDKVQDGLRRMETFTPRLIEAMKKDLEAMP
jgi:hypothetical protein